MGICELGTKQKFDERLNDCVYLSEWLVNKYIYEVWCCT